MISYDLEKATIKLKQHGKISRTEQFSNYPDTSACSPHSELWPVLTDCWHEATLKTEQQLCILKTVESRFREHMSDLALRWTQ